MSSITVQAQCAGSNLEDASSYSVFTFSDFICNAGDQIWGRTAIGGNFTVSNWAIGANGCLVNDANRIDLAVAGNINYSSGNVTNGSVRYGGSLLSAPTIVTPGATISNGALGVDFGTTETHLKTKSSYWASLATTGSITNSGYGTTTLDGSNSGLNVFNLTAASVQQFSYLNLNINVPNGSTVLINVSGNLTNMPQTTVTYNGSQINTGTATSSGFQTCPQSKILWNLSQSTTSMTMNNVGFQGSILAPWTNVSSAGGEMNGQLIVNSVAQSNPGLAVVQVHCTRFNGCLPEMSCFVNAGIDQNICAGGNVTLTGTNPTTGTWTALGANPAGAALGATSSGQANVTFSNNASGEYKFIYTESSCTDTASIFVTNVVANAGNSINLNCTTPSNIIGTSAIGGNTYSWSPATGLNATNIAQPTNSATTTTTYTVTVTGSNGCTATSSVVVNVNKTSPTVNAGSTQNLDCTTTSVTIGTTAIGGNSYAWSPATGLSATNIAQPSASPSATTTYSVTVTGSNGCTATSTVTVNVNTTTPTADAGATQNLNCTTTSATIGTSAIGGNTYSWSPATGLSTTNIAQPSASPSATTTYTVTVTGSNGCTATSSVLVNVNKISPTANAGTTQNLDCTTTSATIGTTAIGGNSYAWSPATGLSATNIAQPIANPSATTTYTVTVTGSNGCTATSTVTVNVNTTTPTANAGATQNLDCTTTSATIGTTAIGGNSYAWSPATGLSATNIAQPTASPSATTIYIVTVTGTNGCTATDVVLVNYSNSLTSLDITAFPNNKFCYGSNIQLEATGQNGASFNWNVPVGCTHSIDTSIAGKSILTINDLQSSCNGVFSITQSITGCASSSPSTITVDGGPVPTINFVTTLCVSNTGQVTVNASGASPLEYAINGGSFQGSNVMTTIPGSTFVVAVQSQNSSCVQHYVGECVYCVPIGSCATPSKDSMVVPSLACIGVAIPVVNYLTNATTATFTTTGTGTFDVSSCNTSPCTVNYIPSAADYANGSVILTAVTDDQDGAGPCQAAHTSKLIKLANELVAPTIVSNSPVCENSLLNFEAVGSLGQVNWTGNGGYTSNLSEVIITNAPATLHGNLTATVSGYGCTNKSSTENIVVVSQPNLNVNINAIPEFCLGSANGAIQVAVTGGSGTYTICYSGNLGNCVTGTTANFQWIAPGNYTVTVVDALCPGNTFSYPVTILPGTLVPTPTVAPTIAACAGENLLLSGTTSVPNSSINWSYQANNFNANGLNVTRYAATPSMSGTYYAKTIDLNGCASNSIPVNVIVEPTPLITHVQINCVGAASTVVITASLPGATLEYSLDGSSYQASNTFTNVAHGNYLLHVKDVNGTCPATFYAYVPNCLCPNEPVVSVDNPTVSCGLTPIPLTGTFTNVGNATWSTSGTGTFSVAGGSSPTSTVYTPSAADLSSGLIYIYLITDDPDGAGPCTPVSRSEPIIMVDSLQIPSITKNQPSYCTGDTVIMTANGVSTPVEWFGVGGFYTDSVVAVLPSATQFLSGKYIVRASGNGCVTKADSVILSIAAPPALTVSTTSVNEGCFGHANGEITVNVTGGSGNYIVCNDLGINCTNTTGQYTFKWLAPATYTIYATDAQCPNAQFTAIDTINAGLEVAPPTTATYNETVCEGEDLILTATGPIGSTYLWTDLKNNFTEYGETITRPNAKTDMTGRFKVQRIVSGCASADKYLDVKVFGIPTILTADTLCVGGDSGRITINALVAGGDTIEYAINEELYQASNVFEYLPNGMYQVKARNKGSDCETIFTNIELYCLCVCNKEANVSVFPNPNAGNFTVNANLVVPSTNIVISVFDYSGRTIFEKPMEAPTGILNYNIDISTYSAGAYMVRVLIDGERFLIPIQVVGKK